MAQAVERRAYRWPHHRPLRANGQPYKGINVLMLWGEALGQGFASPYWMTYKQAQELGGQVRKGENGSLIVYADRIHKIETADNGDEIEREIPFMKGYPVFCVEQIYGLPEHFYARPSPPLPAPERIAVAERFAANSRADIRHGGNRAFYAIDADRVQLPPFESFTNPESYYATLLHELTVIGRATRHGSTANSGTNVEATKAMPTRNWSPNWARPFSAPTWASRPSRSPICRAGAWHAERYA